MIDWQNIEEQIRQLYNLTDAEVNECLFIVENIRTKYINESDTPERISLVDKDNRLLYTIRTGGDIRTTICYSSNQFKNFNNKFNKKIFVVVGSVTIIGLSLLYIKFMM